MRSIACSLIQAVFAAGLLLGAARANAAVTVSFSDPDHFTDIGDSVQGAPNPRLLRELTAYLQSLGDKHLAAGQALLVDVRDIDRAGRLEPWSGGTVPRILDAVTWPRMTVRYELREGGKLVAGEEETLRDQNYLQRAQSGYIGDDLRYEKKMIEDWFVARFGARWTGR
jgi:hypothetical protein